MAQMPAHLAENTVAQAIWKEIERTAVSQGVDPSKGEVTLEESSPRFVEAVRRLERVQGVTIVRRDEALNALVVKLAYEGDEGIPLTGDPGAVVTSKPSIRA